MARRFSKRQKVALFLRSRGRCVMCGVNLIKGWHGDHFQIPWSKGGETDVTNGASLCAKCDSKKGNRFMKFENSIFNLPKNVSLRKWQEKALRHLTATSAADFLLVAVPAAGKTLFALAVVWLFLYEKRIRRIVVVCPTNPLRYQWARAAHRIGLNLDPEYSNSDGRESFDYHGIVVTYQQVASFPDLFRANCQDDTFVIFDEIHHAGDELSWGKALRQAFDPAAFRLLLSGTPFRSDDSTIPFVKYVNGQGQPDFRYSYGMALTEGVCRPIYFPTIEGTACWLGKDGKFKQSSLLEAISFSESGERWRTILDPNGEWLRDVIRQADENLTVMRQNGHREAGGLIIALDQPHAEKLVKVVEEITGTKPVLAISDLPDAQKEIERFAKGSQRWIVAVKMVSEGVDIPRLRVGVYATNICSELFFVQVVGRLLRKQPNIEEQSATLYIPYVKELVKFAERIKEVRDHVLKPQENNELPKVSELQPSETVSESAGSSGEFELVAAVNQTPVINKEVNLFQPISSESKAHHTIFNGEQYSEQELFFAEQINSEIGATIPPVLCAAILRRGLTGGDANAHSTRTNKKFDDFQIEPQRNSPFSQTGCATNAAGTSYKLASVNAVADIPVFKQKEALRKQLQKKAAQLAFEMGIEIGRVHRHWIQSGGSSQRKSTVDELQKKIRWISEMISEVKSGRQIIIP